MWACLPLFYCLWSFLLSLNNWWNFFSLSLQLKSQEELDKRQQEVNDAVKELKAKVKWEIQSTLQDLHCSTKDELEEDAEAALGRNQSFGSQLESLKENFPFTANSASGSELADKLGSSQGHLSVSQLKSAKKTEWQMLTKVVCGPPRSFCLTLEPPSCVWYGLWGKVGSTFHSHSLMAWVNLS